MAPPGSCRRFPAVTERSWSSRNEEETSEIGKQIAAMIRSGDVIFLEGDLGSGKTTLVRAIAAALGASPGDVSSPSFAIVHEYDGAGGPIIHIDGYRLSDVQHEWRQIGIPELLSGPGVKLIEWPKAGFQTLAQPALSIGITTAEDGTRTIAVE